MASNAVVLVIVVGRGATNATVDEDVNNMAKESRMAKRIVMMVRCFENWGEGFWILADYTHTAKLLGFDSLLPRVDATIYFFMMATRRMRIDVIIATMAATIATLLLLTVDVAAAAKRPSFLLPQRRRKFGLLPAIHHSTPTPASVSSFPCTTQRKNEVDRGLSSTLLELRGGASSRKKGTGRTKTASLNGSSSSAKKTATGKAKVRGHTKTSIDEAPTKQSELLTKYKNILPLTRIYITMVGFTTLLGLLLGDELSQGVLALDPVRTFAGLELWRPFTAATYLGPPSIGWLMNAYYLFEYGSSLERAFGTAQHFIFLLLQITFLTSCASLLGIPFFTSSVITSMLHVLSRAMPNQQVKWLIFTVPYWTLPYGLMASDVLQSGQASSAIPHILGIVSGHVYHFHKVIWPKMDKGEDWLIAPDFLRSRLDADYYSSNNGKGKESISNALKARKKRNGRRGKKVGK